jgi:hypothetical protein
MVAIIAATFTGRHTRRKAIRIHTCTAVGKARDGERRLRARLALDLLINVLIGVA